MICSSDRVSSSLVNRYRNFKFLACTACAQLHASTLMLVSISHMHLFRVESRIMLAFTLHYRHNETIQLKLSHNWMSWRYTPTQSSPSGHTYRQHFSLSICGLEFFYIKLLQTTMNRPLLATALNELNCCLTICLCISFISLQMNKRTSRHQQTLWISEYLKHLWKPSLDSKTEQHAEASHEDVDWPACSGSQQTVLDQRDITSDQLYIHHILVEEHHTKALKC